MTQLETSTHVPMQFVKSLLKLAESRRIDIKPILLSAGLDYNPLNHGAPGYVSAIQYSRVYQQILSLLKEDSIVPNGKGISAGAFKMLCYSIIHCKTLNLAIKRTCEFITVFYDKPLQIEFNVHNDKAYLSYPYIYLNNSKKSKAGEAYGLALWHRFFSWLIGKHIELFSVSLLSEQPDNVENYHHLFGVDVHFGAAKNGMSFHTSYLELPLAQNEESLKDFLRTAPYQMMVEPQKADSSKLITNVRRVMGYDLTKGFPSFETIASQLNMSAPTLRRHLRKEGVSYQRLKDQCRKDAAIAYLSRPELSITAVAALMGFTDPSAFHRSFKKWTGVTPGQFRENEFDLEKINQ